MTATGALAGLRVAVVDGVDEVDGGIVSALRAAGAVIVGNAAPTASGRAGADITVTPAGPPVAVCVTPTAAALPCRLSVVASELALADLAMTVLSAEPPPERGRRMFDSRLPPNRWWAWRSMDAPAPW